MYPFLNTDYYGTGGNPREDGGSSSSSSSKGSAKADMTTSDVVLVWKWDPHRAPKRGEVIAFWSPKDPERMIVKRVIAVEGDFVRRRDGFSSSGDDPIKRTVTGAFGEVVGILETGWQQIPQGHIWVEGDHGEEQGRWTWDSNAYGPVRLLFIHLLHAPRMSKTH